MRTEDQIQRAHDIFAAIVLDEVPNPFGESPETTKLCIAALDGLCWVLEHDHNQSLGKNLALAEAWLAERGYVLGEQQ